MSEFRWHISLLGAILAALPSIASPSGDVSIYSSLMSRAVPVMGDHINTFVGSLDVPATQARSVASTLEEDANVAAFIAGKHCDPAALATTACVSLKLVLGEGKVDTKPVDRAIVDENWLVVL
jgi:hypothetical protein